MTFYSAVKMFGSLLYLIGYRSKTLNVYIV